MLRALSGREHEVVSAVTFRDISHEKSITDSTFVFVDPLSDDEITYYIDVIVL